jgi:hypothetical protein
MAQQKWNQLVLRYANACYSGIPIRSLEDFKRVWNPLEMRVDEVLTKVHQSNSFLNSAPTALKDVLFKEEGINPWLLLVASSKKCTGCLSDVYQSLKSSQNANETTLLQLKIPLPPFFLKKRPSHMGLTCDGLPTYFEHIWIDPFFVDIGEVEFFRQSEESFDTKSELLDCITQSRWEGRPWLDDPLANAMASTLFRWQIAIFALSFKNSSPDKQNPLLSSLYHKLDIYTLESHAEQLTQLVFIHSTTPPFLYNDPPPLPLHRNTPLMRPLHFPTGQQQPTLTEFNQPQPFDITSWPVATTNFNMRYAMFDNLKSNLLTYAVLPQVISDTFRETGYQPPSLILRHLPPQERSGDRQ